MDTQQNKPATGSTSRSQAAATPASVTSSQPAAAQQPSSFIDTALESGRNALDSSKKWIEDTHIRETVDQLPQSVKDWSSRAATRVGSLSTTQKVVGGAILAAGLGWLALRKGKSVASPDSDSSQSGRSVYGRSGSFTRTGSAGYQAPDASNRRPAVTNRPSSMPSFGGSANQSSQRAADSDHGTSRYGGASASDFGSYASASSRAEGDKYRSIE
jgi:hypothetical protein